MLSNKKLQANVAYCNAMQSYMTALFGKDMQSLAYNICFTDRFYYDDGSTLPDDDSPAYYLSQLMDYEYQGSMELWFRQQEYLHRSANG